MDAGETRQEHQEDSDRIRNRPQGGSSVRPPSPPLLNSKSQEVHLMSSAEIESKIRELRQLQSLIDEAQIEAEAIKGSLKAHMGEREELRAGEYRVTWKAVTSSRVDTAALKKAAPELVEKFTVTSTTRRFCIA